MNHETRSYDDTQIVFAGVPDPTNSSVSLDTIARAAQALQVSADLLNADRSKHYRAPGS
jgi:hypothetical protein